MLSAVCRPAPTCMHAPTALPAATVCSAGAGPGGRGIAIDDIEETEGEGSERSAGTIVSLHSLPALRGAQPPPAAVRPDQQHIDCWSKSAKIAGVLLLLLHLAVLSLLPSFWSCLQVELVDGEDDEGEEDAEAGKAGAPAGLRRSALLLPFSTSPRSLPLHLSQHSAVAVHSHTFPPLPHFALPHLQTKMLATQATQRWLLDLMLRSA
jgi:hypothetical protein